MSAMRVHGVGYLLTNDTAGATTTIREFGYGKNFEDSAFAPKGSEINFDDYDIYYAMRSAPRRQWRFTHRRVRGVAVGCQIVAARFGIPAIILLLPMDLPLAT